MRRANNKRIPVMLDPGKNLAFNDLKKAIVK